MKIEEVSITKIKKDPNQPRTVIDDARIEGMAQSMKTEGIINPIEVDEDYMIVTGEMRWRAAIMAGFIKVPVKVISTPNATNRFRRQMVENLHHNTMTAMDTAQGIERLLLDRGIDSQRRCKSYGKKAVKQVAEEIGKTHQWIYDTLALLKEENPEVKAYLKTKRAKPSLLRIVRRRGLEEHQEALKLKIARGEIKDGHTLEELTHAMQEYPEQSRKLLKQTYNSRLRDNIDKINKICPPEKEPMEAPQEPREKARREVKRLSRQLTDVTSLIKSVNEKIDWNDVPPETLDMLQQNNQRLFAAFKVYMEFVSALWTKKVFEPQQKRKELT